jgi:hypothetical protein
MRPLLKRQFVDADARQPGRPVSARLGVGADVGDAALR